jgi:hypothetical protein
MSKIAQRVAEQWLRKCAAPATLQMVLQELANLQELSDNLTDIEDQVSQTFRMAKTIDPEVVSQFDTLKKAIEGLRQAQATEKAIAEILKHYPEDKTALRAAKDAAVMIKRFEKHAAEARKIINRLSKKEMPPALKKMSDSLARMLQGRLVNPKDLKVTWWQESAEEYRTRQKGIRYLVLFRVSHPFADNEGVRGVGLSESTLQPGVFSVSVHYGGGYSATAFSSNPQPTTAKAEVAKFLEALKGSPLVKGEGDRTKARVQAATQLYDDIKYRWDRNYRGDARSEMDPKGLSMEFTNRSIPHDSYASHYEVEDGLKDESRTIMQWLGPILTRHKGLVKNHSFDAGEKGYMTLYIELN